MALKLQVTLQAYMRCIVYSVKTIAKVINVGSTPTTPPVYLFVVCKLKRFAFCLANL